jgi:hypothetical protein
MPQRELRTGAQAGHRRRADLRPRSESSIRLQRYPFTKQACPAFQAVAITDGGITQTALLPLRMLKKESQHFGTRVRTGGVGEAAPRIAACPRVRCPVNSPQFGIDTVRGNQP